MIELNEDTTSQLLILTTNSIRPSRGRRASIQQTFAIHDIDSHYDRPWQANLEDKCPKETRPHCTSMVELLIVYELRRVRQSSRSETTLRPFARTVVAANKYPGRRYLMRAERVATRCHQLGGVVPCAREECPVDCKHLSQKGHEDICRKWNNTSSLGGRSRARA